MMKTPSLQSTLIWYRDGDGDGFEGFNGYDYGM